MQEYSKSQRNRIKRGQKRATYDVETINSILDAGFIAFVSYIFEGSPITLPMAYGRKNNKIYLHGSTANRMLTSLIESKETSMTIMHLDALILARSGLHHSVNYRSATLFGSVKKVESDSDKKAGLKTAMDQMIFGRWDKLRPMHQKELDRTLVIEVTIESASAKIRDVGVEDEPDDYELNIWAGLVPLKQVAEHPVSDQGLPQEMDIPEHVLDYCQQNQSQL